MVLTFSFLPPSDFLDVTDRLNRSNFAQPSDDFLYGTDWFIHSGFPIQSELAEVSMRLSGSGGDSGHRFVSSSNFANSFGLPKSSNFEVTLNQDSSADLVDSNSHIDTDLFRDFRLQTASSSLGSVGHVIVGLVSVMAFLVLAIFILRRMKRVVAESSDGIEMVIETTDGSIHSTGDLMRSLEDEFTAATQYATITDTELRANGMTEFEFTDGQESLFQI
jgi:hypothetical protein